VKTVKIVGISGVGKTRIINTLVSANSHITSISYSDFLIECSGLRIDQLGQLTVAHYEAASVALRNRLASIKERGMHDLVLMDDHLELVTAKDLVNLYRDELTVAMILLEAPAIDIVARRLSDRQRVRPQDSIEQIDLTQQEIHSRAVELSRALDIPPLIVQNRNPRHTAGRIESFLRCLLGD